jgi:twitching motility protein PilT
MPSTPHTLHALLAQAVAQYASDLHLAAGQVPRVRVQGKLLPISGDCATMVTHEALLGMLVKQVDGTQLAQLQQGTEIDFALAVPNVGRFRANAFLHQHGCGAVMRHIPDQTPTLAMLETPAVLSSLLQQVGLVLVTGPTGSGKSTTLAAMVQHLNTHTQQHIVTLEDPVEFVHASDQCLITQREIGAHSNSFAQALRAALREDPDVILVGELRDLETIRLALTAAETGHLVLASLHTRSAASTIDRLVDVFDAQEKSLVRTQLSEALVGVLSQTLCPSPSGTARAAVFETLVVNPALRHLIREGKTAQMQNVLQTGAALGMQTLQQALDQARAHGRIA